MTYELRGEYKSFAYLDGKPVAGALVAQFPKPQEAEARQRFFDLVAAANDAESARVESERLREVNRDWLEDNRRLNGLITEAVAFLRASESALSQRERFHLDLWYARVGAGAALSGEAPPEGSVCGWCHHPASIGPCPKWVMREGVSEPCDCDDPSHRKEGA